MTTARADMFNSPERDRFFQSIDFPWYNLARSDDPNGVPVPYALYHCQPVAPQTIANLRQASAAVGQVLMETWQLMKELDAEDLEYYGLPPETIDLVKFDAVPPWCMRLDWCWNEEKGIYRVIEVNSQTPSFWYEATMGNNLVAKHFRMQPIDSEPTRMLQFSFQDQLRRAAAQINKPLSQCRIACTALNNPEDLNTMRWLSQYADIPIHTFPLENMRLRNGYCVYDADDDQAIDILILWYPIEWLILDTDADGEELWPELEELILQQKIAVVNFGSAFALQSKGIFALIQDLGTELFSAEAAAAIIDYFPKTALEPEAIGSSYFAKPMWGRQGEGAYAIVDGVQAFAGMSQDPYYTDQQYVYQELLEFPTVELAGQEMTELWGVWLYNDGADERLVADAVGKRLSLGKVTDDGAYWCPIAYSAI